ncbi:SRA stem-loop-interacting RNA-binding protein, mitochondrial-like isoform X2 [Montipora capricornis]|uniref:SRA stem-loop-interacting RNA-binding protein, mitochondrial-like isoform X2 n=1 Tax=Montipora capricornis TaxID=246305 RepID=UPI0035F14246
MNTLLPSLRLSKMAASRLQIFVAKLPWTVCSDTLREYFQQFGPVLGSRVIFDYYSGRSKKYGFVEFEKPESLDKVMAEANHFIDGTKVHVQSKIHDKQQTRRLPLADNRRQTDSNRDYSEV